MTAMQINGLGLAGGFGSGKEGLLSALVKKEAPLAWAELRDHQLPYFRADTSILENYLDKRALRRIDHFSRMALLGAFQALDDAGQSDLDRSRLGVVICSGYGALTTTFKFLDSVLEDGDAFASPTAFSNSVHNAAAAHISMQLKITGPSLTVSQFDQSLVSGLLSAQQWLAEGRAEAVLLGAVDEYCPVLGFCWERFLGGRVSAGMRPLDFPATTAIAGEGAAFFLLQQRTSGSPRYAEIEQVEMGNLCGSRPRLPRERPLLLNCDGYPETGNVYRQQLTGEQPVACHTPLYGASPVSMAFDLAVASLSLAQGELFDSTDDGGDYFNGPVVGGAQACTALSCLRYGLAGEYAAIHLGKG